MVEMNSTARTELGLPNGSTGDCNDPRYSKWLHTTSLEPLMAVVSLAVSAVKRIALDTPSLPVTHCWVRGEPIRLSAVYWIHSKPACVCSDPNCRGIRADLPTP